MLRRSPSSHITGLGVGRSVTIRLTSHRPHFIARRSVAHRVKGKTSSFRSGDHTDSNRFVDALTIKENFAAMDSFGASLATLYREIPNARST